MSKWEYFEALLNFLTYFTSPLYLLFRFLVADMKEIIDAGAKVRCGFHALFIRRMSKLFPNVFFFLEQESILQRQNAKKIALLDL